MKTDQEPTRRTAADEVILSHPAFGQISVVRVQGQRTLYGTDFIHNGFVRITIQRSELHRHLSRDWYHDTTPVVTVDLSEAQWATFVSSFGIGGGVPCTIAREGLTGVPTIPFRDEGQEFKVETDKALSKALAEVRALRTAVEENTAGLSKTKQAALLEKVRVAEKSLSDHLPFVADSLAEHMEQRVEKAKVEVNAYAVNTLMRLGLDAVNEQRRALGQQEVPLPLQIESKADD